MFKVHNISQCLTPLGHWGSESSDITGCTIWRRYLPTYSVCAFIRSCFVLHILLNKYSLVSCSIFIAKARPLPFVFELLLRQCKFDFVMLSLILWPRLWNGFVGPLCAQRLLDHYKVNRVSALPILFLSNKSALTANDILILNMFIYS